jgi:hypothetical protein
MSLFMVMACCAFHLSDGIRANVWLGVSLCVTNCSFQEMMCIRRSFKKNYYIFSCLLNFK